MSLDFLATLTGRLRPLPTDLLATSADLHRWLAAASLVARAPVATPQLLRAARILREAIFRLATGAIARTPSRKGDLAILNRWAARLIPAPQLKINAGGRSLVFIRQDVAACLAAIAQDAATLLGGPEAGRIRKCARLECSILFVDTSRAGNRRWCLMTACGNRVKVAQFRGRRRAMGLAQP